MTGTRRFARWTRFAALGTAWGLGLGAGTLAGCNKSEDSGDGAPATPAPLPSWAPVASKDASKPAPGPAYFAVKDQGIAVLEVDGRSRLAVRLEHDAMAMSVTAKGELLFTTIEGVFALRDGVAVELAKDEAIGMEMLETCEDVQEDPKGRLWVIGSKGTIAIRTGDAWSKVSAAQHGMDLQFRYSEMLFDTDGRSWIAADDALYRQADGGELKWDAVDVTAIAPEDYQRNFKQVAMAGDGTVLTVLSDGLFARTADGWKKGALSNNFTSLDHMAAFGSTVAVMVGNDLHRVGPDGVNVMSAGETTWTASRVFDLELDGSGRTWIATDNGPVVVTGQEAIQWTPGTLAGVLGRVEEIVVAGAGPTTLPTKTEAIKGAVEVGVTKGGTPLAGATIEMCEDPKQVFTKTPCESAVWKWSVESGDNGRVRFTDVPVGTYGLVFEIGGEWSEYFNPMSPFECCTQIQAGQTLDVGTFELGK